MVAGHDVSDAELRHVHSTVKNKLLLQYGDIRRAFRAFDKDFSGKMSMDEAMGMLKNLNIHVPESHFSALAALADLDG